MPSSPSRLLPYYTITTSYDGSGSGEFSGKRISGLRRGGHYGIACANSNARPDSGRRWPDELRPECLVYGATIVRARRTFGGVKESMVRGRELRRVIAHQVWHDGADSPLFIVQHDGRAAILARAELQRAIRIVGVKRLSIQLRFLVDFQVAVPEKDDMGCLLPGYALANGAVAGVIVYGIFIGVSANVVASPGVFVSHA